MKKVLSVLGMLVLSLGLAGCGENEAQKELDKNDTEKSTAKDSSENKDTEKKEEDIWTYYEDADWSGEWEGLQFDIQKVVVSDKAPKIDDNGEEVKSSAVGVKFKVENTTSDKVYNTYPDQATLVTSTGEQVEADMMVSDAVGGEIHEGVIKEGNLIFYLDRGEADKIDWVKLTWNNDYTDPDGNYDNDKYHEQEVKLDLK